VGDDRTHHQDGVGVPDEIERLWTPHRMAYIRGQNKPADSTEGECPFCRMPTLDDEEGLVVHRGETAFVVLNLYPYSPGHLMVCPFRHVADYTELTDEETREVARLTQTAMRVIREVSGAHGFNVGMNQGRGRRRHRRPPAPARRAALGRRPELHADHRPHPHTPAADVRHARPAGIGVAGLTSARCR
jgi:ATP adenylyltransferase